MLRFGSRGSEVEELQLFLAAEGYDIGSSGADGIFGSKTRAAVRQFQSDQGITVDGVVGPTTQGKIDTFGIPDEEPVEEEPEIDPESGEPVPPTATDEFEDDVVGPEGVTEGDGATPGIMAGGTIYRVANPDQEDFYIVGYEYPPGSGHSFFYRFDSVEALEQSIGPNFGGGTVDIGGVLAEDSLGEWTDAGDTNEIIGVSGSFGSFLNDIIQNVSVAAGIGDPTRLSAALAEPSIQIIMAKAAEGDWSDAQVKAAMRNNEYYQDVVYPGIKNFYGQTDNPEAAYAMYKQNVASNLVKLGVERDADGSFDSTLKAMLDGGVSDVAFANFTPTFLRAKGNDNYRTSLNQWLGAAGIAPISDFNSFFDMLGGNASPELNDIAELASISFVAGEGGLNVESDLIREIADRTDLSEEQVASSFLQSDRDLLALGDAGLRTAGISQADIIATRSGFTTGTRSLGEMENLIAKVKKEQGIADDPTATIFTDFNREGAPVKKGLQSTISEGA
jgi:peptidoglycan hydrolase-like protein with peptidoglycan-binding domain